jgi:GntR family transcriptional regulator
MSQMPETAQALYRPLYAQVREALVRRLIDGTWGPGAALPSEIQIAAELGVSQGTVRKALDEMVADRLVVRRQGRGTFVAEHDANRALFHFFRITADDGVKQLPDSAVISVKSVPADKDCAALFSLGEGAELIDITRVRLLGAAPIISEHISLPADAFPGFDPAEPLPNNLYAFYETRFQITVTRAEESLKAVAAGPIEAGQLGVAVGYPLLAIDRRAYTLDGRLVEARLSLCRTETHHYANVLG